MRIYRVDLYDPCNGSGGFTYESSRRKAEKRAREHVRETPELLDGKVYKGIDDIVSVEEITLTKRGLLEILDQWGSHPDNG